MTIKRDGKDDNAVLETSFLPDEATTLLPAADTSSETDDTNVTEPEKTSNGEQDN